MPNYATRADVVVAAGGLARLLQIADFDNDGLEDTGLVDGAIDEAEGLIDSYLRKKREVPLAAAPQVIVRMAANMAVYVLKARRDAVTENDRLLEEDRIKWLENFAKGLVTLGVDPAPASSPHNQPRVSDKRSSRDESRENLKGFV